MKPTITIGLAGDVMLGRTLDPVMNARGYDYPWGNMLAVMRDTDMNIINLETTFTISNDRAEKTFNFKAAPDKITSLQHAHISVANLANNHVLDFGAEGLLETTRTLRHAGIPYVGAGQDIAEASQPVVIAKNNIRVGVLGITDNEPEWKATDRPGTHYVDPENREEHLALFHAVAALRKEADIVIVSIHWGPNMREKPTQHFVEFAHRLSQHGAQVIHGHSAHILQGIELYNKSLILYDTGDFVDDYRVDDGLRNDLAAFFILEAEQEGLLDLTIMPTRIHQYQVNKAGPEDHAWIMNRIRRLSEDLGTHIPGEGRIHLKPGSKEIEAASVTP